MVNTYKTVDDIPDDGKSVVERLLKCGALQLSKEGYINITEDMLRILIIIGRLGLI